MKNSFSFWSTTILVSFVAAPWVIAASQETVLNCKDIVSLEDSQVQVLLESYERGREDDLGYTLAAIAMKESSAGKYRINPRSSDYGAYGINYKTVQRLSNVSYYQSIDLIEEIIFDDDKGSKYALDTLKWNLKHFNNNWRKSLMMYNKGHQWHSGEAYAADIAMKVRILRTCLPMS